MTSNIMNSRLRLPRAAALSFFAIAGLSSIANAKVTIVDNGKSNITIVIPADAPTTVQKAAKELQKNIELATKAKLPLQNDSADINGSYISLGNTKQAKSASVSSESLKYDAFHITTKNENLYILGKDTADDEWTDEYGKSNGTANGIYTFLEDYLNVRWLMPGDIGRDVPTKSTLILDDLSRTETPLFKMRSLTHVKDYTSRAQHENSNIWGERLKLGGRRHATANEFGHNWWRPINEGFGGKRVNDLDTDAVKKAYAEHPDWFPMDENGKRPFPTARNNKLEITNPSLVKWFAERAILEMKRAERPFAFAISPEDFPSGWSKSPEALKLYDDAPSYAPPGHRGRIVSSMVLKWYHDVAQIVAKEYPEGKISGYLYSNFIYPPTKYSEKLPPNFTPMIAPDQVYGFRMYREENQKYFHSVMDAWAKVVTGDWYYYDLPSVLFKQHAAEIGGGNFAGSSGLIAPIAPENLNILFRQLVKSHINGGTFYGDVSNSSSAILNYTLAKMQWDPHLDANAVQKEWLQRAYGNDAGAVMEQLYIKLDGWLGDRLRSTKKDAYYLTQEILESVYGKNYPEIERLILQAKQQKMTDLQRERFQIAEDNIAVLQWRLRNAGFLPEGFTSKLQKTDAQISDMIGKGDFRDDFPMFNGITNNSTYYERYGKNPMWISWEAHLAENAPASAKPKYPKWEKGQFLIYAVKDGDIRIETQSVDHGKYFSAYEIKHVRKHRGYVTQTGIFNTENPIVISAKAGETYLLQTPLRNTSDFQIQVKNAEVARGEMDGTKLFLSGGDAPIYVYYVPSKDPVSVSNGDGGAIIQKWTQKASSREAATDFAKKYFSKTSQVRPFDKDWIFGEDADDNGVKRGVLNADFEDKSWMTIDPFSQWQLQQPPEGAYYGVGWYRLKFNLPELAKEDKSAIYFGAIDGNAEIYLNGQKIGEHKLGDAPTYKGWNDEFAVDATNAIKAGVNILAVKVTSKNKDSASGMFKGAAMITGRNPAK